jgi:hypothetical protein
MSDRRRQARSVFLPPAEARVDIASDATAIASKKTSPVRLWDLSTGGCLLESREQFPVGTVGVLRIDLDGHQWCEWFRVCRVQAEEGRQGTSLLGAEFLLLAPPRHDSLRRAARDLLGM